MRLEPCAVKIASTVLRGRSASNGTLLPDESDAARIILFMRLVLTLLLFSQRSQSLSIQIFFDIGVAIATEQNPTIFA